MTWFSFILFWSFLFIIQQSSCDLTNFQKKLKPDESSSLLDKIISFTGKGQEAIDDLRCPEKWQRFLHLCYFLSNYMSTVAQANHTCSIFHLNYSRLMYIKHPLEIFYAADILTKNNLSNFLLEIDPDLMKGGKIVNMLSSNDRTQWEEFGKRFLQESLNSNIKRQLSPDLANKDRSYEDDTNDGIANKKINRESTTAAGTDIDNNNEDYKEFVNITDIHDSCQHIKWNVVNEDSNVLILTIESELNQSICSLSNADYTSAYSHLCQYVLDRCLNNIACGKHGRCINDQTGFNCSCSFLYTGVFCEKYSHQDIQTIIGIIVIIIVAFVTFSQPRRLLFDIIKWFINLRRQQPIPPLGLQPAATDDGNNDPLPSQNAPRVDRPSTDHPPEEDKNKNEFELEPEEQHLRNIFLGILTIVFFLFFFKFPPVPYIKLPQLNNTNLSKIDSLIDKKVHTIGQYRRYAIFRIDNFIYLLVSGLLVFIFSILIKKEKRVKDEYDDRSGLVEPMKLLRITDRFKTTAIIVIQMFEILEILEETVIDIDGSAQYGVFAQILKRVFFVILIALRYYPTLASLQFQSIFVRLLTVAYFIGSMIYKTLYESSGIHWLLFLIKFRQSTQEGLYIDLRSWSFLHGSIRNIVHYIFIGYICAELIMRLFYDSINIMFRKRKFWEIPHRTIEECSYKADRENKRFLRNLKKKTATVNPDQEGCWDSIRKHVTSIYECDNKFRYTTIAVCTYTVAYIFLFHLTGTVILLYNTQTNSYIRYIKHLFEAVLNIEIKEGSFQIEVIISAFITMIIYGIQLFLSIKNFRKSIGDLYTRYLEEPELCKKLKKREIIRKSTQYPSYLLLYLLGGFFICFHLILLFSVMIKRVIFTRIESSKKEATVGYILPIIVLYLLQKIIIQCLHKIFDYFDRRDENDLNLKINILDSILLYLKLISCAFIGIIASVIRLIFSALVNIIFMPRIDYTYLVEPLKGLDSAHQSFQAFLRLEILCIHPLLLEFSPSVQVVPEANIPAGEATPEPPSDEQQVDAENFDDAQSVTTGAQSAVDSDESDTDTISDDDGALRNPLLFDEPSSNRL